MSKFEDRAKDLQKNIEELVRHFQAGSTTSLDGEFSLQENKLIDLVGQRQSCIMREISDYLHVAVSTVTAIVDRLEEKEIVRRERSDQDRRIVKIVLTKSGQKLYQSHVDELLKLCRGVLGALDEEDQVIYLNLVKKITGSAAQQFASGQMAASK